MMLGLALLFMGDTGKYQSLVHARVVEWQTRQT
jgi:hypothetical protein